MPAKIKLQERLNAPGHTVFQMTVPRWIVEKLGWKKGTTILVSLHNRIMRAKEEPK